MCKKISIITVVYNNCSKIEQTIKSVLGQRYGQYEYIIIDGGSNDGTVDIIKKYSNQLAYWISEPDKGIYDAMNKGIAVASGDFINFMNAGDEFVNSEVLSDFIPQIRPDAIVAYGDYKINLDGNSAYIRPTPITSLKKKIPFCHQACFVKTDYHKNHIFDTSFKILADYNLFYNAYYKDHALFQYINVGVAVYDVGAENASNKYFKFYIRERYRIWGIENNPLLQLPSECELIYIWASQKIKKILPSRMVMRIKLLVDSFRTHEKLF